MGKKKTKSTQTNKPIYSSQIEGAANTQQAAYEESAPKIAEFSDNMLDVSSGLLDKYYEGDPTINAAQDYITSTLSADSANNPYLEDMIDMTGDNTRRQLQTQLGTRGGIGGSAEYDIVARALAENEMKYRYDDYNAQQGYKQNAASLAPSITQSSYLPLESAFSTGQIGAMMPMQAALANSSGVGGLLGQYQTVNGKQTSSGGIGEVVGMGLQAASLFSDRRLKTDVKRVGKTDAGSPIYTYRYQGEGPYHMGVMADEVPEANGPDVDGYATVRYEEVV